jgi:hypothetical protein
MQVIVSLLPDITAVATLPFFGGQGGGNVLVENTNQSYQVLQPAPGTVVVPDSQVDLENTDGTSLQSVSLPATEPLLLVAPDATYNLDNTEGSTLFLGSIPSSDNETIIAPDGTGNVKNSANTTVATGLVPSGGSANITAPDGTILINGDNSFPTIPSGGSENIMVENTQGAAVGSFDPNSNSWVVPDANYTVKDQNNNTLASGSLPSGSTSDINVTVPQTIELRQQIIAGLLFFERTVTVFEASTINSINNGGLSSFSVLKNGTPVTAPFTLAAGDVLRFEFTQAATNTEVILGGSYV